MDRSKVYVYFPPICVVFPKIVILVFVEDKKKHHKNVSYYFDADGTRVKWKIKYKKTRAMMLQQWKAKYIGELKLFTSGDVVTPNT